MKLLLNEHLSPLLIQRLADLFPGSTHVSTVGLERASDLDVWMYAQSNDLIIVTKDSDFNDVSVYRGFPPRVIWLRLGNCTTDQIEETLRRGYPQIASFVSDTTAGILELF